MSSPRALRRGGVWLVAALMTAAFAGCATDPAEDPVQIKLNDLDARVTKIDRVVANNSLIDLSNQMEALRADLRGLHNDIDELNHAVDISRKQQHDLYADLDRRLKALEARTVVGGGSVGADGGAAAAGTGSSGSAGGGAGPSGSGSATAGAASAAGAGSAGSGASQGAGGANPPGTAPDAASYQAAFALLKNSQYDQAIGAFHQFLETYPDSSLADNAQYWLGEAYYVNKTYPEALNAFQRVVSRYPQSRKVPDALLKVGYCDYELKQFQAAKDVLTQVVSSYPDSAAGKLAQQRLDKMAAEKH
jgi:tol-pal system protein YbgF